MPERQVAWALPDLIAPGSEHVTSITVLGSMGNCVVVVMVFAHAALSPVHSAKFVIY